MPAANPYLTTWLRLATAPSLNSSQSLQLVSHFGLETIQHHPNQLLKLNLKPTTQKHLNQSNQSYIDKALVWSETKDHHIICWDDEDYPFLLREIASPPIVIYIKGNKALLNKTQLAMVGSRMPSVTGSETAFSFAKQLADAGLIITSGLAKGIDTASHKGALAANQPTIAVMGTGLEQIYPKQNQQLADVICETGTLLSEFPIDSAAKPWHFPRRNRIMTGLSCGVLVIEAKVKSGSLVSAYHALEQNREVFAIPGSIYNPLSKGCHRLINAGAKLVESADDILQELTPTLHSAQKTNKKCLPVTKSLAEDQQKLVECVGFEPTSADKIIFRSGLTAQRVCSMLPVLALKNIIDIVPGGYIRKGESSN